MRTNPKIEKCVHLGLRRSGCRVLCQRSCGQEREADAECQQQAGSPPHLDRMIAVLCEEVSVRVGLECALAILVLDVDEAAGAVSQHEAGFHLMSSIAPGRVCPGTQLPVPSPSPTGSERAELVNMAAVSSGMQAALL